MRVALLTKFLDSVVLFGLDAKPPTRDPSSQVSQPYTSLSIEMGCSIGVPVSMDREGPR